MKRALCWLGVAVALAAPASVNADSGLKSRQGSDYSQDHNSIRQVMACDRESDSHGVRADLVPMGSSVPHTVNDDNGANNACVSSGVYSQKIYRHRIVEVIPWENDPVGPWKYPS